MSRTFLLLGSLNAFLAVALGAFGAHALRARLPADRLAVYQVGVDYHLIHALGLILIAALSDRWGASARVCWAGWLLLAGIAFFSGSLYLLAFSGVRAWGMVTPLGGVCFLAGWALLAVAAIREPPAPWSGGS